MEKFVFDMDFHFRHLTDNEIWEKRKRYAATQHRIERKVIKELEGLIPNEWVGDLKEFKVSCPHKRSIFEAEAENEEKAKRIISKSAKEYFEKTKLAKFYKLHKITFTNRGQVKKKLFKCTMTKSAIFQISSTDKEQAIEDVRNLYLSRTFEISHEALINLNFEEIPIGSEEPISYFRFYQYYDEEHILENVDLHDDFEKYDIRTAKPYGFLNYVNKENLFKVKITDVRSKPVLFEFFDEEPTIEDVRELFGKGTRFSWNHKKVNTRVKVEEAGEDEIPHYIIKPEDIRREAQPSWI